MGKTKIAIGADHAGFTLKETLKEYLLSLDYEVEDTGSESSDSVDYPDYAGKVASSLIENRAEKGVLICGTGIGMSIAANRHKGIRAALVTSPFHARMAAKHNRANVLVFGGKVTSPQEAKIMLKEWLSTEFEGGRHLRRVNKIDGKNTD